DVLFAEGEITFPDRYTVRERSAGDPEQLEKAAKLLGAAVNPIIFMGGGIQRSEAGVELTRLAELLQAPVVISRNGRGGISDRHYVAQTLLAEQEYLPTADVVLLAGTRSVGIFGAPARSYTTGQTVIQIDIDPEEIGRMTPVDVGIVADLKAGLAELAERVGKHNRSRPSREAELTAFKQAAFDRYLRVQPQADFAMAIRAEVPDDGVIVGEFTQVSYWSFYALPVYEPNTFLTPGYQGTLGYGFTTAMGAKVGTPNVPVVSINGDGGFGFSLSELSTLVQHDIRLIAVVFSDNAYGNVLRYQRDDFGGRIIGSELVNPDYQLLAKAFGVTARKAVTPAELRVQLREAIQADEPTLIEVPVGSMPDQAKIMGVR
ncbi:MAG: thiamine pyrophosphate-binding protein, partial [Thermomicrobiales bacterium]|nr:thiamine pyrophosphate-binding protein [Thermomicrobiales bacterium]